MNRLLLTFVLLFSLSLSAQDDPLSFESVVGSWEQVRIDKGLQYNTIHYAKVADSDKAGVLTIYEDGQTVVAVRKHRGRICHPSDVPKASNGSVKLDAADRELDFFNAHRQIIRTWELLSVSDEMLVVKVRS